MQVTNLDKAINFYKKLGFIHKMSLPQIPAELFSIGVEEPGIILIKASEPKPSKFWIEVANATQAQQECANLGIPGKLIEHGTGLTYEITDFDDNIIGFTDYSKKPELARRIQ